MPRLGLIAAWALNLAGLALAATSEVHAAEPAARWAGQDGKDFVGGEPGPAPNGYQDVHIQVAGLPPGRALAEVVLKGHGHGAWSSANRGKAAVHVARGTRPGSFDLYIEPYQREAGREFELQWKLDDGRAGGTYFAGGRADPNLRAAGLGVEARWLPPAAGGAAPPDRAGPGTCVGPDGFEDARVEVARLPPQVEVREVAVGLGGSNRATWRSGVNPSGGASGEFVRDHDDLTRGTFHFAPTPEVAGKPLQVTVTYANDRADSAIVTAGKLPSPRPIATPKLPDLAESTARARWVGQVEGGAGPRGEARVAVEGIAPGRTIVAAALSDGVASTWLHRRDDSVRFEAGPSPQRLRLARPAPGLLELGLVPDRDESGTTLTLRLMDASGRQEVVRFPGGPVDFGRVAPPLPPGAVEARPGDDLQALAARAGTVRLAPGTYRLDRPLVLPRPIRVEGAGATLVFDPARGEKPWAAAIVVGAGGTTLAGFAVRFAGAGRWDRAVAHGPAVIAAVAPRGDGREDEPIRQVALDGLDLEAPPAGSDWEEALALVKLLDARSGRVERCRLKGGTVRIGNGPWSIADNEFLGTRPNTFSHGVFAALYGHDLLIARNRAHDVGPSGKTWRFLVLAQRGVNDRIVDNVVDGGIGPRQDDPHPHQNAPEVILTEAYRLRYEGKPAAISPDGRLLAIPAPPGGPASPGDAVAILAGSEAGQWRAIVQALGPQLYLLDLPIPADSAAVSLATGFVRETFSGNTVDCRGSAIAANLVLAGNVFGAKVVGNKFYGGGETIRLHAAPSESPVHWGWSHAPFLGGLFADNLIEDSAALGVCGFGVEHGPAIKANRGRTYMSLVLRDNTFRWTDAGRAQRQAIAPGREATPPRVAIGYAPSLDPDELQVAERGTKVEGAAPEALWVAGARVNGAVVRDAPLRPQP